MLCIGTTVRNFYVLLGNFTCTYRAFLDVWWLLFVIVVILSLLTWEFAQQAFFITFLLARTYFDVLNSVQSPNIMNML